MVVLCLSLSVTHGAFSQTQEAAQLLLNYEKLKQLEGQFTAVATTHGFTRAFLWSTFLMLGAAVVTIVGLSIKHKDLATDGQSGPVHVG